MSASVPQPFVTPEEYLAIERAAEFRSEYYDGQMYAMSGARLPHNRIAANLARHLGNQLGGGPCEAMVADMRVQLRNAYVYPDIVVVRGEPQLLDDEFDVLLNPRVVVEILSPSTEKWDRGGKFARYKQAESLTDYVRVNQDRVRIEQFSRAGDDWLPREWTRLDDVLNLGSIRCAIPLADIYARVILPTAPPGA